MTPPNVTAEHLARVDEMLSEVRSHVSDVLIRRDAILQGLREGATGDLVVMIEKVGGAAYEALRCIFDEGELSPRVEISLGVIPPEKWETIRALFPKRHDHASLYDNGLAIDGFTAQVGNVHVRAQTDSRDQTDEERASREAAQATRAIR